MFQILFLELPGQSQAVFTLADENFGLWMRGHDVACAMGYVRPNNAIRDHVSDSDKKTLPELIKTLNLYIDVPPGWHSDTKMINIDGVIDLLNYSGKPVAAEVYRWILNKVLVQRYELNCNNRIQDAEVKFLAIEAEKDRIIGNLTTEVQTKDQTIAVRDQTIAVNHQTIISLHQTIQSDQQTIESTQKSLKRKHEILEEAQPRLTMLCKNPGRQFCLRVMKRVRMDLLGNQIYEYAFIRCQQRYVYQLMEKYCSHQWKKELSFDGIPNSMVTLNKLKEELDNEKICYKVKRNKISFQKDIDITPRVERLVEESRMIE